LLWECYELLDDNEHGLFPAFGEAAS
jgi:hypothetical protein